MLLALSTGHAVALGLVACAFIAFALLSALVIPKRWPQYPGKHLGWFIVATLVFFVAMLSAVELFAAEPEETAAETEANTPGMTIQQPPPPPGGPGGEGAERQDRLLVPGLRELPHVQGGECDGDGRAGPRHRAQGQGRGVRPRVDRRPQQGDRVRLPAEHHAGELRADPDADADQRSGGVPDSVRLSPP